MPADFDLPGALRRVRRIADMSQQELAEAAGMSVGTIGNAESGARDLPVALVARIAGLAELRLALVDAGGREVMPMTDAAVRDMGGRKFPAHLDTRYSDEGWWHGEHRYDRDQPWYTFDRRRDWRDETRRAVGTPEDHQLPQPGDSPEQRQAERRHARWVARGEERQRRFLAGEFAHVREPFACTCPGECDELDDRSGRPVHAAACRCDCDVA